MDLIEQKRAQNACKKVVKKLAHSVTAFCVTRILEQLIAHLLNDEQKLFSDSRGRGGRGGTESLTARERARWVAKRTGRDGDGVCVKKSSTGRAEAG